jgi:hypothetical protein
MLDPSALECNRVGFCRCAVPQNGQQIVKTACIGHAFLQYSTIAPHLIRQPF